MNSISKLFIVILLLLNTLNAKDDAFEKKIRDEVNKIIENKAEKTFQGLNFSVGIALSIDGNNDRVEEAIVVDNIVRVTKENNYIPRIMLEAHYYFEGNKESIFGDKKTGKFLDVLFKNNEWGIGPFIAIEPSSNDEIIKSVAMGIMLGVKKSDKTNSTNSWNFGIGAIVEPNVMTLGDGIYANQPLPIGETDIRFVEKSKWGVLFISSYNF